MAESQIAITEGAGKNLHTWSRSISAVTQEDQTVLLGQPYLAAYSVIAPAISTATSASHILEIMAGASLNVAIQQVRIKQVVSAGAAAMASIQVLRLTAAGTGGTVVTARPLDSGDAAAGATAMTLPTVKGTEGVQLDLIDFPLRAAIVAAEQEYRWEPPVGVKPWIIPAGTTNGLTFKIVTGVATSTISIVVVCTELSFL